MKIVQKYSFLDRACYLIQWRRDYHSAQEIKEYTEIDDYGKACIVNSIGFQVFQNDHCICLSSNLVPENNITAHPLVEGKFIGLTHIPKSAIISKTHIKVFGTSKKKKK